MSNVTKQISTVHNLLESVPAANADQIGDRQHHAPAPVASTETSTGWDSYEVWRRFIKDARDRRRSEPR